MQFHSRRLIWVLTFSKLSYLIPVVNVPRNEMLTIMFMTSLMIKNVCHLFNMSHLDGELWTQKLLILRR